MSERLNTYLQRADIREEGKTTILELPQHGEVEGVVVELDENNELDSVQQSIVLLHLERILKALNEEADVADIRSKISTTIKAKLTGE